MYPSLLIFLRKKFTLYRHVSRFRIYILNRSYDYIKIGFIKENGKSQNVAQCAWNCEKFSYRVDGPDIIAPNFLNYKSFLSFKVEYHGVSSEIKY